MRLTISTNSSGEISLLFVHYIGFWAIFSSKNAELLKKCDQILIDYVKRNLAGPANARSNFHSRALFKLLDCFYKVETASIDGYKMYSCLKQSKFTFLVIRRLQISFSNNNTTKKCITSETTIIYWCCIVGQWQIDGLLWRSQGLWFIYFYFIAL